MELTCYRRLYLTESRHAVRLSDDPTRAFRKEMVVPETGPIHALVNGLEIEMAMFDPATDLDDLSEAGPPGAIYRDPIERLARGEHCILARHNGLIIGICWFAVGRPVYIRYLDWELPLKVNECYESGIYIRPEYRGHRLLHAVSHAYRKKASQMVMAAGVAKLDINFLFLTEPANETSLRSTYRRGGRVHEKIARIRIAKWQWVYRRPASWTPDRRPWPLSSRPR